MILVFFLVSILLSCIPLVHSVTISTPMCPESFKCPDLVTFKYPFYNVTDTRCGLIKVDCTPEGNKIQLPGGSFDIVGNSDPPDSDSYFNIVIRNATFTNLVINNSCEALMNNLTSQSPTPLLYSILILRAITLFKCTNNPASAQQQTDAYFYPRGYKSYNRCKNYTFYYNYSNETVPNNLPDACQVVYLPVNLPSTSVPDETNIFSVLSHVRLFSFKLSSTCEDCYNKGYRCETKNGHVGCSSSIKVDAERQSREPSPISSQDGRRKQLPLILVLSVLGVGSLIIIIFYLKRKTKIRKKAKNNVKVEMFLKNHKFLAPKRYSYSEVIKMTNSFKVKLGQGGFGSVFKGVLRNKNLVAVKVLSEAKGDGEDFINEVASVGMTSHVNIVSLMGFCLEGRKRALIYEFMPNGSLERFIYSCGSSTNSHIGWEKLHQIAVGIARGLEYLHRGCSTRILHFDIKPHNILLDNDFCPKISDFGLAKLFHEKESKICVSHMRGTPGYIAPELFFRSFGDVSHKADVYSYGMMILEMAAGGRKNIEVGVDHTSDIYFPQWIYKKVELHEEQLGLHGIVCDEENRIARKMIIVGLWCIQTNPLSRPTITRVLEMLEGELESIEIPPKPYLCSPPRSLGSPSANSLHSYCSSTLTF